MRTLEKKHLSSFATDVLYGLTQSPKAISSKYFYDKEGDKIFQEIMAMPEYYLTRAELEIFSQQSNEIIKAMKASEKEFNLVEFGAGDGYKTKLLLKQLLDQSVEFTYYPVDISQNILNELEGNLKDEFPQLKVSTMNLDYFQALETLSTLNSNKTITLFLGSNIGNFHSEEAASFLKAFKKQSKQGDMLLLGVDLKKDPRIITKAYADPHGITAAFNMNLLTRMNKELDANFDLQHFAHHTFYEPMSGEVVSYLVSLIKQRIHFGALDKSFSFEAYEIIHTEISKKYSLVELEWMAQRLGFSITSHFTDDKDYFVDSLWEIL